MSDLYLTEIYLNAPDLVRLGNNNRFPRTSTTQNYLVHYALGELFQGKAPKPFWIDPKSNGDRYIRVLGYTAHDADELQAASALFSSPRIAALCDESRLYAKKMPAIPQGTTVGFDVWAVPTIRKGSAGSVTSPSGEEYTWVEGQELDYFLDRTWHEGEEVTRQQAYDGWIRHQFDVRDLGAELQGTVSMSAFTHTEMSRRTPPKDGKRTMKRLALRPVAALHGKVLIKDSHAFRAALASGIGPHKSFGYGMLKLRPA